jgi:hypothetical protein
MFCDVLYLKSPATKVSLCPLSLALSACSIQVWRAASNRPMSLHTEELVPKQPRLKKLTADCGLGSANLGYGRFLRPTAMRGLPVSRGQVSRFHCVCGAVSNAWLVTSLQSPKESASDVRNAVMREGLETGHCVGGLEYTCVVTFFYKVGLSEFLCRMCLYFLKIATRTDEGE